MDSSMHSNLSLSSPFRISSKRKVPPFRPRFVKSSSEHMLPTSTLSPNKCVFSSKHRLVKRNLPFFQSKNKLQITNQHSELRLFSLLKYDLFHVILRVNLWLILFILLSLWTIAILIFAGIYMHIDKKNLNSNCGLAEEGYAIGFSPAFAFSLETCTTVGYGLPNGSNSFFEGECGAVQAAIYFQMVWSMLFNACLTAFMFARIAKCEARGVQVIFSNTAIVSHRPDVPYPCFQFRVFDIDGSYPVVEAHVRLYVVTQKSPIPIPLRIVIPDDEYGGMLYLSLPSQVVHAMDAYSPIVPPSKVKCHASATVPGDGLHLRQVDGSTNNRDDVCCPVCGESYGTVGRLIKHGKYQYMMESHDGYPVKGSHQEVDWDEVEELLEKSTTWTLQQLQAFFRSNVSEILCVVEGIDPLASGTFQAIHSYQYQDINFGEAHFADCVCLNQNQELVVDLDFFHQIRPNVDLVESERNAKANLLDGIVETEKAKTTATPMEYEALSVSFQDTVERLSTEWNEQNGTLLQQRLHTYDSSHSQAAEQEDDGNQLEPRNLMYSQPAQPQMLQVNSPTQVHFAPTAQPHTAPAAPATEAQAFTPTTQRLTAPAPPPSPKLALPTQTSKNLTTQSAHTITPRKVSTSLRRHSSPVTNNEHPPPLFTLDEDLMKGRSPPQALQSTGRQPSKRASMPSNVMGSLVTGKFD